MGYESLGEETIVHSLFGNVKSAERKHQRYRVYLSSQEKPYKCNFEVLGQPTICGQISHVTPGPWIQDLAKMNVALTDTLGASMPIGILIGADVAGKILTGNRIQLHSGLVAMETHIGWTLMGKVPGEGTENCVSSIVTSMFIKEADISELWRLDSIGIREPSEHQTKQEKDQSVKKYFLETTKIDIEGRYEVSLPWIENHPPLPDNRDLAEKRLHSVVKKLDNNLFSDYDAVFQQWLHDGIIETVPRDELNKNGHYLPHRPVVKESSATTRIRPVFDASAKLKMMPSLNECLESGPNLIELIPSVMLRFREGKCAVIADITKAFLQISLNVTDRDSLRFLWFTDENKEKITVYRHKRVVFGVKCSPFLLGAVIQLHLQKTLEGSDFNPDIINRLQKSFYVDNVSTSLDTPEQLENFVYGSKKIMAEGKFELRGWKSTGCADISSCTRANVLGVLWDYQKDILFVNLDCLKELDLANITKRDILSVSHRIFDPIGFICPVMICPKLLLQKMWDTKIDWDTAVSDDIAQEFIKWFKELQVLQNVNIPRWIGKSVFDETGCSIHTFCDASKDAYSTVIYLKVENESGVTVQLIAAKSRVAPLKKTSIPRLELLAATVGARLTDTIISEMSWKHVPVYYWTDSSTVLAWIKQESNWTVFVWNRISEIRKLTKPYQWNHIPGEYNPADLPSRGCNASHLLKSNWWEGPEWLKKPSNEWPITRNLEFCTAEINEEKTKKKTNDFSTDVCLVNKDGMCNLCGSIVNTDIPCCTELESKWYLKYFSDYHKIIRLIGWICRFLTNCKTSKNLRLSRELTTDEIKIAERKLLKDVQEEVFSGVEDKSLASLAPILDENGLIRLKTKVCEKEDTFAFRYPIILPANHPVVKALILDYLAYLAHEIVRCQGETLSTNACRQLILSVAI